MHEEPSTACALVQKLNTTSQKPCRLRISFWTLSTKKYARIILYDQRFESLMPNYEFPQLIGMLNF